MEFDGIEVAFEIAAKAVYAEKEIKAILKSDKGFEEQNAGVREVINELKDTLEENGLYTDEAFESDDIGFEADKLIKSAIEKAKRIFVKKYKEDDTDYIAKLNDVKANGSVEKHLSEFASVTKNLTGDLEKDVKAIYKIREELVGGGLTDFNNIGELAESYATLLYGGKVNKYTATNVSKILKRELDISISDYKDTIDAEILAMVVNYNDKPTNKIHMLYIEDLNKEKEARVKRMSIAYDKKIPKAREVDNEKLKSILEPIVSDIHNTKFYKEKLDAYSAWKLVFDAILSSAYIISGHRAVSVVTTGIGSIGVSAAFTALAIKIGLYLLSTFTMVNGTKKLVFGLDKTLIQLEQSLSK